MAAPDAKHPRPNGLTNLGDVLMERIELGSLVNVIGFVADFQAPRKTNGSDYKCSISLVGPTTEYNKVTYHLFIRDPSVLQSVSVGDVILLFNVKFQKRGNASSLLSYQTTEMHIYQRGKMPALPLDASLAHIGPDKSSRDMLPFHRYATQFYHDAQGRVALPTKEEFEASVAQSKNVRDKFFLLQDIRENMYCDMVVQVVRDPFYNSDACTLWVTDYTENPLFFDHAPKTADGDGTRDGDPYNYANWNDHVEPEETQWDGPPGKRSIQISAFQPHCDLIRNSDIGVNTWLQLSNVHIKFGNNMNNLEGKLHEDSKFPDRLRVEILETNVSHPDEANIRLKEAIRRKASLKVVSGKPKSGQERGQKRQSTADAEEDSVANGVEPAQQRTANKKQRQSERQAIAQPPAPDRPLSSKERRLAQRELSEKARLLAMAETIVQDTPSLNSATSHEKARLTRQVHEANRRGTSAGLCGLNRKIVCEMFSLQPSTVAEMTRWHKYVAPVGSSSTKFTLPFVCVQYRADVRVTDFYPPQLERFSAPVTEYDMMSDCGVSDVDDEDEEVGRLRKQGGRTTQWKWAFWLRLEDSDPDKKKHKDEMWVVVNNEQAECLLGLDASDLVRDKDTLDKLRERLNIVWGNLEECKLVSDPQPRPTATTNSNTNGRGSAAPLRPWDPASHFGPEVPPPSSPVGPPPQQQQQPSAHRPRVELTNQPFTCCVRQYGIRRTEADPEKMNAGEGKRWERVYGLFGTKLNYDP